MVDLAFEPAHVLARKLRRREISAEALMRLYLDRVARFNPKLNAIVVLDADKALASAREADSELARGEVRVTGGFGDRTVRLAAEVDVMTREDAWRIRVRAQHVGHGHDTGVRVGHQEPPRARCAAAVPVSRYEANPPVKRRAVRRRAPWRLARACKCSRRWAITRRHAAVVTTTA